MRCSCARNLRVLLFILLQVGHGHSDATGASHGNYVAR